MAAIGALIWLVSAVLAYFITDVAFHCCCRQAWDRPTKEFVLLCSLLLGPLYLVISVELLIFAAISTGLAENKTRRYKDS